MDSAALVGFWIVWSVVNGFIAEEKCRSVGLSIVFSLVFSPVIIYAYLLAVPSLPPKAK